MTATLMNEPADATESAISVDLSKDSDQIRVTTAATGGQCAEKATSLVSSAAKVLGWVVESLVYAPSSAPRVHTKDPGPSAAAKQRALLWEYIEEMRSLHDDWNGYGSEAPNPFAIDFAKQIVLSAKAIVPTRVVASAQGGVGICFSSAEKYGDIECLNTGEILATVSDGKGIPEVWEVKGAESEGAIERIASFINS
jgi:hypothetical protein